MIVILDGFFLTLFTLQCSLCFQFSSHSRLTSESKDYISKLPMEEKTHCLICVVSGNSISQMSGEIIKKMREISKEATKPGK